MRRRHRLMIPALACLAVFIPGKGPVRAEPVSGGRGGGAVESFVSPDELGPAEGASGPTRPAAVDEAPRPKPKPRPRRRHTPPKPMAPNPAAGTSAVSAPTAVTYSDWRALDPASTLVIESGRGRIIVELRPDFAPASVARVLLLARRGLYDGLLFHRVIDGFVAQTGNPNNHDGGKSDEPNLPPEFSFRLGADTPHVVVAHQAGDDLGFVGASPYESVGDGRMAASPDHRITAWGAYCPGVMGMGRDEAPGSGNSEIFFMRDPARRLERSYSVVGRVVQGLDVIRSLPVGEPPASPERMIRVRVMADMPQEERPAIQMLNTKGSEFRALADRVRAARGADFSVCDIEIPVKDR